MKWEEIQNQLTNAIEALKSFNPYEIILFGSYSAGTFHEESDIDLLIIIDSDQFMNTYEEKSELKAVLRRSLRDLNKKIAIDLLVYTKKEFHQLQSENNPFIEEITSTGKILYEKAGWRMAEICKARYWFCGETSGIRRINPGCRLLGIIEEAGINLKIDEDLLDRVNEVYIESRYPADWGLLPNGTPRKETVETFYEFAIEVYNQVLNLLS